MRGLNCMNCRGGTPYLTAYEIAVKHGFRGTEAEWIASLYHRRIVRVTSRTGDDFTCDQTLETIRDWHRENLVEMALDDGRTARLSEVGATAVFTTEWFETDDGQAYETWVVGEGVNIVQRHVIEWSEETREMTWNDIKPAGGIPVTDLDAEVQASLRDLDRVYRLPGSGIPPSDLNESIRNSFYKAAGIGLAQSTTQGGTVPKTAGNTDYFSLRPNVIVAVHFISPVEASATLDINGTGAKPIYCHNMPITAGIIGYGDTATFVYDGSKYNLLALDTARAPVNYGVANEGKLLAVGPDGKAMPSDDTFYIRPSGGIPWEDLAAPAVGLLELESGELILRGATYDEIYVAYASQQKVTFLCELDTGTMTIFQASKADPTNKAINLYSIVDNTLYYATITENVGHNYLSGALSSKTL